jgi:hypothetical protein
MQLKSTPKKIYYNTTVILSLHKQLSVIGSSAFWALQLAESAATSLQLEATQTPKSISNAIDWLLCIGAFRQQLLKKNSRDSS